MTSRTRNPIFLLGFGILIALTAVHCAVAWSNYSSLDGTSGVWIGLADDFSKGVFYRPIIGENGYGGTRYFPLYFVLHGLLINAGIDRFAGGFVLSVASVLLLMIGVYRLLRKNGADPVRSLVGALLLLTSTSVLLSLTTIRGDALPLAFSILGLAALDEWKGGAWNLFHASIFFTLAFACKVTAVTGLAASLFVLALNRRFKPAIHLLAFCTVGYLSVLGLMILGSEGRVIDVFRTCSSAGASWLDILKSPLRFLTVMSYMDTGALLSMFLGIFSFLFLLRSSNSRKVWSYFLFTGAATVLVFGSPGTNFNQFIDIQGASVSLFILFLSRLDEQSSRFGEYLIFTLILLASLGIVVYIRFFDSNHFRQEYVEIQEYLSKKKNNSLILSENPIIPVMLGRSPYVLDPFMLRIIREKKPEIRSDITDRLRKGQFGNVVLFSADPRTARGRARLQEDIFGEGFIEALEAGYRLEREVGNQLIYSPKAGL